MIRYHELLRQRLKATNTDEQMFFRLAHIYCFGSDVDVSTDVVQFKLHAIIPRYVVLYLDTM